MNCIFYDIIIAALLLLFLWRGYRKGFVLTLCGFLALFVAFFGASVLSGLLAEPAAKLIEPAVASGIHDAVSVYWQAAQSVDGSGVLDDLPLEDLLEGLRDSPVYQAIAETFQTAVQAGAIELTGNAVQAVAHYIAVQIVRTALFGALFLLLLTAWFIFSRSLDLVAKLPVLNAVNRWSGAAVGLLEGALLVFIACWLLEDGFLPREAVQGSLLLRFFCTYSPLDLLPLISQASVHD